MNYKHKDLIDILFGAAICILLALSFHLVCLPSKDGIIFGLYSLPKFTLIISFGISSIFFVFMKDKLISFVLDKFPNLISEPANPKISDSHNRHLLCIFLLLVGTYLISFFFIPTIRGDFAIQYFAYSQYQQDISSAIDNQKFVTIQNDEIVIAEKKIKSWPPGPFYILKLTEAILPISRSECLRLLGFLSTLISTVFLYKILSFFTNDLNFLRIGVVILVFYPFFTGLSYINFSNADIFSVGVITMLLYYSINWIKQFQGKGEDINLRNYWHLLLLSFALGSIFWLKKSTFVIAAAVFMFLVGYFLIINWRKNITKSLIAVVVFLSPFLTFKFSEYQHNKKQESEFHLLYLSNAQSIKEQERQYYDELLGTYHSRSTSGLQLLLSILSGPGWFVLGNQTFSSFGDFMTYTGILEIISLKLHTNHAILLAFALSMPLTIVSITFIVKKHKRLCVDFLFLLFITAITVLAFGFITYKNEVFNVIINKDFRYRMPVAIILQTLILLLVCRIKYKILKNFSVHFLITYFFVFPIISSIIYYKNSYELSNKWDNQSSPNGFHISCSVPWINSKTYDLVNSKNSSYESSDILNIIITDEAYGKFSYFMASELKGNIANVNITDFSKLLKHRFNWSCIHILFHNSLRNKIKEIGIDLEFAGADAIAPSEYMYAFVNSLK